MWYTLGMSDEKTDKIVSANMLAVESAPSLQIPEAKERVEMAPEVNVESEPSAPVKKEAPAVIQESVRQTMAPAGAAATLAQKDKVLKEVEDILAADLGAIYANLPDVKKAMFRQKGEEVAQTIRQMFVSGKVKVHAILEAIRNWLRLIPGINKFFLEQEAKIKTDRVLAYGEKFTRQSLNNI